jgi:branched-chain amino acid transport system ATP-binding protein/urea transport system ATP-binding protein
MAKETVPLIETAALTMRFGGVVAVDAVNFRLEESELRCLIGPNGAGKSTFFKCLTGQYRPSAGTVRFRGHDITGALTHDIARLGVGIKTQIPNVFNGLDVRENIRIAAARGGKTRAAISRVIDEVVTRVGIADLSSRIVGRLAHGQRQLVELATVLAGEPQVILLDEPAAGMTNEETARTASIIKEINRTTALIVVEHDMQFVKMIARKVTVFHQGAILVEAPVAEILSNPTVRDVYLGRRIAA